MVNFLRNLYKKAKEIVKTKRFVLGSSIILAAYFLIRAYRK